MSRRKVKDVVDLMHQDPERRLRDVAIPDEDTCKYCDSTILEEGPWHDEKCPKYVEYVDDEEEDDESPFSGFLKNYVELEGDRTTQREDS